MGFSDSTMWRRAYAYWGPSAEFKIEAERPPVQRVFGRMDGTIWVQTSRGMYDLPDGVMATFDVFDPKGHFECEVDVWGELDPRYDQLFLEEDCLVVITGLGSARGAMYGILDPDENDEAEPVTVILYDLPEVKLAAD